MTLFESSADRPLADRMRPRILEEVIGQEHLTGPGRLLAALAADRRPASLLFWGPPGTGKTTLGLVMAHEWDADFVALSAVTAGVRDLRETAAAARARRQSGGRRTVLFVDEIHRFNRTQQDALLPHIESGLLTLLGATTENPSFEVNAALLSRMRVVTLRPHSPESLLRCVDTALADQARGVGRPDLQVDASARDTIVASADGDARRALNTLEAGAALVSPGGTLSLEIVHEALQTVPLRFDRSGEEHFNVVSALQKSIRGGDADAALYWLARLLLSGEDRLYVARRLVRTAIEDIGLAEPNALLLAMTTVEAVRFLGEPEGDLALAELTIYLALAPHSNAAWRALDRATGLVRESGSLPVPLALRNAPTAWMKAQGYGEGYRYSHDHTAAAGWQEFLPDSLRGSTLYDPEGRGTEGRLAERLEAFRALARERRAGEKKSGGSEEPPL